MSSDPPGSVIAVDGVDGSGKSQFAAALAGALAAAGRRAALLHVDDFRRSLELDGLSPDEESALYYDRYFDFAAVSAALKAAVAALPDGGLTILEGVMVLRVALPAGTPLVVLEVSPAEARRRIAARDQAKGRTAAEIARRIDRRYFPAQTRYRAALDPSGRADLIVDNEDWAHPRPLLRRDDRFPPGLAAALDRLFASG